MPSHNPASQRQRVLDFVSPLVADLVFYEVFDAALMERSGDHPAYGTAYPDSRLFPDHELVLIAPHDEEGQLLRYYYATTRATQDLYNFEHTKTELGSEKYDTITRTYLIKREDYDPDSPEVGAAMPDSPTGQFSDTYILLTKQQKRGAKELDSLFIIEQRVYIKRVAISNTKYDEAVAGVLVDTATLFYRGETYVGASGPSLIEVAILNEAEWGVSSGGVLTEGKQLSEDWFLVTSTDMIPQDKTVADSKFGGLLLKTYDTYITYSWPAVLGDDGSLLADGITPVGDLGFEIMDWEDKEGNARNYVRPLFEKHGYRGPTRATIVEEWIQTLPTISSDADRPFILEPLPIVYNAPYLSVSVPPTLHAAIFATCDTSSSDPTWGANSGSKRTFPATNRADWPASFTATVEVTPFRGGFVIRHVTVYAPESLT